MSKVDTAWLRMDSASNLMMILGVWTLRPGIGHEACASAWKSGCCRTTAFASASRKTRRRDAGSTTQLRHPRARAREAAQAPRKGGAQAALQARIGELAMQPLDRGRPLWQAHLVEDYEGGSALIVRIHHCIADGIALIAVTMSLVDGGAAPPAPRAQGSGRRRRSLVRRHAGQALHRRRAEGAGRRRRRRRALAGDAAASRRKAWRLAGSGAPGLPGAGRRGRDGADARRLADAPEGQAGQRQARGLVPAAAAGRSAAVGKALNCSINDVLLSCVAGAIGQYLRAQGDDVEASRSAP
jgi:diacylglycerol O-acyltransferase